MYLTRSLNHFRKLRTASIAKSGSFLYSSSPRHKISVPIPSEMTVKLNDTEEQVCTLFHECTEHLKTEKGINVICRVAGGWVRDKLLGEESNDIDIALSEMMGYPFAEHLAAFASSRGIETGTISKIAKNPDQSKHLETATFKVFGLDLDLVNLRSEQYAEDSRIPIDVAFGTPLQDALRRDITINALFYNIHTRTVEDFTEKGLDDLKNGVVRTPLPPRETFFDDPLRVLRCIRFASRYGFDIVPEITEAAKDPLIQGALISKVARERVGEELAKMIKGRNPLHSVELIREHQLYNAIFSVLPVEFVSSFSKQITSTEPSLAAPSILSDILRTVETPNSPVLPEIHPLLLTAILNDSSCIPRLFLAAILTPYKGVTYKDKKGKVLPASELVLRESVKLGTQNHYLDGIPLLLAASEVTKEQVRLDMKGHAKERVMIGLALRDKAVHSPNTGLHWSSSYLFSLVQELVPHYDVNSKTLNVEEARSLVHLYNAFAARVVALELQDAAEAKPLLSGKDILVSLSVPKPGPWMSDALNKVVEWQLEFPQGTKEECIEWLKVLRDTGVLDFGASAGRGAGKGRAGKRLRTG